MSSPWTSSLRQNPTSCPASMIERRAARVRVNMSNSVSPSPPTDGALKNRQIFREPREHFQDRKAVVEADVTPHGGIRSRQSGEIPKARSCVLDDLGLRNVLQVIGGADDVVGDNVRQVRNDGEHHVVVLRIHHVDIRPAAPPEFRQLFYCGRIGSGQGREYAPPVLEQVGKAGIGAGFLVSGEWMTWNEMHASGI
jgi:hypothetical protein